MGLYRDLGGGVLELLHGDSSQRWLVVKRTVVPSVPRLEVKVSETEVSVKFQSQVSPYTFGC